MEWKFKYILEIAILDIQMWSWQNSVNYSEILFTLYIHTVAKYLTWLINPCFSNL